MKKIPILMTFSALMLFSLAGCSKNTGPTYYTVTFRNYDESILSQSSVEAGKTAIYEGVSPTRASTDEFIYSFSGWDKSLDNIQGDTVRYAQYIETAIPKTTYYTVSFKNYDGNLLYETYVEEGSDASYLGDIPTREETSEYIYTFSGWNQSLEDISSDLVCIAQYTETKKEVKTYYTVTFRNYDNSLLSQSTVEKGKDAVYEGTTPSRIGTIKDDYVFIGWDHSLENVNSDLVCVAQYNIVHTKWTVSFKNYDGSLLYETYVANGESVTYKGATPNKPETSEYVYSFTGWNQSLSNITEDLVCVAQFSETKKHVDTYYSVTFKNYDNSILYETTVIEGGTAVYKGVTPTRADSHEIAYTFVGWDRSLADITSDSIFVAQFTESFREYTVKFYSYNDILLYTDSVHYQESATYVGTTPTKPSTSSHYYVFEGWDKDLTSITQSISTRPIFSEHLIENTVLVKANNGEPDQEITFTYGDNYDFGKPTFSGYDFLGWYIDETTVIPNSGIWTYTNTSVVNAKWGIDNFVFSLNEDDTYQVSLTPKGKLATEIIIPSVFEDKQVTTLGADFAREDTNITSVTIPSTIKTIPQYSFYNCSNLKEVNLSDGLVKIEKYAFDSCNLKKLNIPRTCLTIEMCAFESNKSLYQVYIPISVSKVEQYAFYTINSYAYICIEHDSEPSWGTNWRGSTPCYTCCTKLVETDEFTYVTRRVSGNDNVIIMKLSDATSQLESYTVPSVIEGINDVRIRENLFRENVNIRNVDISGITRIGDYAFYKCPNLNSVTFSNSLTLIGSHAFEDCDSLTRIEIPDSVTKINGSAFDGCDNLSYAFIPSTTTTISSYAFYTCPKLTIYTSAHSASSGWNSYWKNTQPIYYDFVSLKGTDDFNYVVQSYMGNYYVTITGLKESAKSKPNIVIPDEFDGISDIRLASYLFSGLPGLKSIDLGSGVKSISSYCFYNCSSLETVILHDGVTTIGSHGFDGCSSLKSINMPSSLTTISTFGFNGCSSLREIVIPIGVASIGAYAFDCGGRISLLIESSVNQSGWVSYWSGSSSNNKQFIYDYVSSGVSGEFRYAKASNGVSDTIYILGLVDGSLATNLVVPDEIEEISNIKIANYAFSGNGILKTIDLGNSVTYIGTYAFRDNISLASVFIPLSCSKIMNYAFSGCKTTCVLNCEASSLPSTWESNWNYSSCQVVWDYHK